MTWFWQGRLVVAEAESSAAAIENAAKLLQRSARALTKAAREGNPAKIRQAISQIQQAAAETARNGARVDRAWPLSDEDVSNYLDREFVRELIAAFPVIVQVLANQSACRCTRLACANAKSTTREPRVPQPGRVCSRMPRRLTAMSRLGS